MLNDQYSLVFLSVRQAVKKFNLVYLVKFLFDLSLGQLF